MKHVLVTDYIPNIYELKDYELIANDIIKIHNISNIESHDKLLLIDSNQNIKADVISIESDRILLSIDNPIMNKNKIFVYGKQITDLHLIDKDFIYTLNVAATQELDTILQWHTNDKDSSMNHNTVNLYGESLISRIKNSNLKYPN
jgi:hypothetical protein